MKAFEKKQVLKERAKILALEPAHKKTDEESIDVVVFLLTYEKYAIETDYVSEVYPLKQLTPLPCTPAFVLGIINIRGRIISVIDLKKFFDLPEKGLTDLNKVIVLNNDDMEFGILADKMHGTETIPVSEIQPPLSTLTGIKSQYLKGIAKECLIILNAAKILSDPKIIVHEEVEIS